jgi:CelD/BcsL family acetyltransferase involved in cellulose biosynthesis
MIEVSLLDLDEQLDGLEDVWDRLAGDSAEDNPFRRWLWARTWWKHYGQNRRLAILLAREAGAVVGIAPLFVEPRSSWFATRDLRFLGGTDVCSEYLGLIIRRGLEPQVVWSFLRFLFDEWNHEWDALRWTDIPKESPEVDLIQAFLAERGLAGGWRAGTQNLFLRFPSTWDQYLSGLSSKRRTKVKRICREFKDLAGTEFAIVDSADQFPRAWDELRMLHNRHWREVGLVGRFVSRPFDAFHTEVAAEFLKRKMLLLGSLRIEDNAVASCYCFRLGNTVYEYQRGHDPAWIKRRPGHALQFHLFQAAIERGARCWDYLRGDYDHKRDWAKERRTTIDFAVPVPRALMVERYHVEQVLGSARRRLGKWRRWVVSR